MHSVIIACTITTLITTYIYIASFKVQLSQQLHCSVSYRWGYRNIGLDQIITSFKGKTFTTMESINAQTKGITSERTAQNVLDRHRLSFLLQQPLLEQSPMSRNRVSEPEIPGGINHSIRFYPPSCKFTHIYKSYRNKELFRNVYD